MKKLKGRAYARVTLVAFSSHGVREQPELSDDQYPLCQKGQMGTGQMGTPICAIFDAIFAVLGVLLTRLVCRQEHVFGARWHLVS